MESAFCRVFQTVFRIALPILPYREPKIVSSCTELGGIIDREQIKSVLVVTDKGIAAGVCSQNDGHKNGAEKFIKAIKELNAKMGIPKKLSGIKKEDIPVMARHAEREANPLYPVPKLMTEKELEEFYYKVADWSK